MTTPDEYLVLAFIASQVAFGCAYLIVFRVKGPRRKPLNMVTYAETRDEKV